MYDKNHDNCEFGLLKGYRVSFHKSFKCFSVFLKVVSKLLSVVLGLLRCMYNYRMAQTTQWSPAILDYMKNVKSNISTCLA